MSVLEDQVVVITGAAGNLGSAAAGRFRDAGASVVLVDREPDRLRRAFPDLAASSGHLLVGGVDMTDADSVGRVVDLAVARFGRVDGLFNTVGGFRGGKPVAEEELAVWDAMLEINLRTTLLSCRAVVPRMREQGAGRIVNVAARLGLASVAGFAAYGAAKGAVLRLTESLAEEVRDAGVNVNCIVPGILDTPQNREAMPKADFRTWVAPEAVADVAVFLVSDAARAITGAAIPVYGCGGA